MPSETRTPPIATADGQCADCDSDFEISMKLTQRTFGRLPYHHQAEVYFSHDLNLAQNERAQRGPSMHAQTQFVNDWRKAFYDFSWKLPAS